MLRKLTYYTTFWLISTLAIAQQKIDRIEIIEQKLEELSTEATPGLSEKTYLSVSGVSIQEFLRGLAEAHNLNVSIDPALNIRVVNNFKGETVQNVLLFLAKEYKLDIQFVGSIMSFKAYIPPPAPVKQIKPKQLQLTFSKQDSSVSYDLRDDKMMEFIREFAQLSGINISISPQLSSLKLNGFVSKMKYERALQKLGYANKFKVQRDEFGDFEFRSYNEEEKQTRNQNGKVKKKSALNLSEGLTQGVTKLEIKQDSLGKSRISIAAIDAPIIDMIKSLSDQLGYEYFLYGNPTGNATITINNATYDEFLAGVLQGTEFTFSKEDSVYLIGERNYEGIRATKTIAMQFRSVKEIEQYIPGDMKKGVELKVFEELNSVIVSGSAPQIKEIEQFLYHIDKVVPMVTIEVILVDVRRSRTTSTGIRAGLGNDTNSVGGTVSPGVNFKLSTGAINDLIGRLENSSAINLGRVNKNFYVSLNAEERKNNVNVRSTPKLSTLNGHEATLLLGSTRYFSIQNQNFQGNLSPILSTTTRYQSVEANLSVKITPIVSGDEQVTMEIEFENSDFLEIPDDAPPPTTTQSFSSMIRVKNREMIVLGGLERVENSTSASGLPLLARIPVVRWFFGVNSKTKSRNKTLIFIRPTILY